MTTHTYRDVVRNYLRKNPHLKYLESFITNDRLGNNVCQNRATLTKSVLVLDKIGSGWEERPQASSLRFWERRPNADAQAIILDFLDSNTIQELGTEFAISPEVFQTHLAGSEQHFKGAWDASPLTSANCLRSVRQRENFFSIDYRRPYHVPNDATFEYFDASRKQRCSLLRSFHWTPGVDVLFHHERFTVAWFAGNSTRQQGAVICICDPPALADVQDTLFQECVDTIKRLPAAFAFNHSSPIRHFEAPLHRVLGLWNTVAFHMDHHIGLLEDQLENDFWARPQNPVTILHKSQRLARRIITYQGQIHSLEYDLGSSGSSSSTTTTTSPTPLPNIATDTAHLTEQLIALRHRTDKAIPALQATIAIHEGAKASSLTAVALWFAPLSLAVSLVSIDGHSPFGGRKYAIMAAIAVPLLVLVIAVANTSDRFIAALGARRSGRALMALFKPETRV